ncbi:ABC transporter permease [Aureimonas ureilytica]|uniref:ABC transporter permease n=1 Tax=Aureimonas ureilytica TaxID=401562 RepID=A0A175REU2_9HYPH|nr:ABC transporter permease [Aureimonas ureilytica]KTR01414.1 ABC transporter permease [Aureimonas ureilytica]
MTIPAVAPARGTRASRYKRLLPRPGSGGAFTSFALVIGVWWLATVLAPVSSTILPTPLDTAHAFAEMARSGVLWTDLAASLSRAAIGFAIGGSLGVLVGLLTGRTRVFRLLLNPFLAVLRPIPAIALVPVAIVWFGIGEGSKYFVIAYTVFLAVWFNTHQGMDYVPDIYIRASRSLATSRLREFFLVVVPAAAPHILAGIRLGVALAFLSLVAAELTGASSGIGYRLQEARQYIRTDRMFALLIELGLIGALIDMAVYRLGRRIVHWQQA